MQGWVADLDAAGGENGFHVPGAQLGARILAPGFAVARGEGLVRKEPADGGAAS